MSKVTFFTVCGGGEEYEFLLGSIEHHAKLGRHFILDVSGGPPPGIQNLPSGVQFFRNPIYDSGDWKKFRLASALEDARKGALEIFPDTDFLVHLDCDEYFDVEALRPLLGRYERLEVPRVFIFQTIHWRCGEALRFGPSEWHLRAWDVRAKVEVVKNLSWPVSPSYNGNPEHHPVLSPKNIRHEIVQVARPIHYHVHYQLGQKKDFLETAQSTIDGWPGGTPVENPCPMPVPLVKWDLEGTLPSSKFFQFFP